MMQLEIDKTGLYDTAAEDMGKIFVSTELGGGGSATAKSIAIAKKGLRNLLIHAELLNAPLALEPSVEIDMPDGDCFTFAASRACLNQWLIWGILWKKAISPPGSGQKITPDARPNIAMRAALVF